MSIVEKLADFVQFLIAASAKFPRHDILEAVRMASSPSVPPLLDNSTPGPSVVPKKKRRKRSKRVEISAVAPTPPAPQASKRPKPVILHDAAKWVTIVDLVKEGKLNRLEGRCISTGIKVSLKTIDDHRAFTEWLTENDVPFHTYPQVRERVLRVVIKRVPVELDAVHVKVDLIMRGLPVLHVHRMHNPRTKKPCDMVLCQLPLSSEGRRIFDVGTVCERSDIAVEAARVRMAPTQCHRCQRYGHAARGCRGGPRCVRCAGDHSSADCPRPRSEPASCVLCGAQGHSASYRGCPKAPRSRRPAPTNPRPPYDPEQSLQDDHEVWHVYEKLRPLFDMIETHSSPLKIVRENLELCNSIINSYKNIATAFVERVPDIRNTGVNIQMPEYGMRDQVAAPIRVQRNIPSIGGDPGGYAAVLSAWLCFYSRPCPGLFYRPSSRSRSCLDTGDRLPHCQLLATLDCLRVSWKQLVW
ncbi:unnamed protein product, partial [Iphiclides podalirius]